MGPVPGGGPQVIDRDVGRNGVDIALTPEVVRHGSSLLKDLRRHDGRSHTNHDAGLAKVIDALAENTKINACGSAKNTPLRLGMDVDNVVANAWMHSQRRTGGKSSRCKRRVWVRMFDVSPALGP